MPYTREDLGLDVSEHQEAERDNAGKVELHYTDLFPNTMAAFCMAFMAGEKKYAYKNFQLGGKPDREYFDGARRHLLKLISGQEHDSDGVHHAAKVISNMAMLLDNNRDILDMHARPEEFKELEGLRAPHKAALMVEPVKGQPVW